MASRLKQNAALMAAAVALIGAWEGLKLVAYKDPIGIPTICFGETRGVKMGDKYTVEQCKAMLGDALVEFEAGMLKCLKNPAAIPDKVYASMLSLTYNIGPGGWCKSSIPRLLNEQKYRAACDRLLLFVKAGGKTLKGLVNRRKAERKLCLDGIVEAGK